MNSFSKSVVSLQKYLLYFTYKRNLNSLGYPKVKSANEKDILNRLAGWQADNRHNQNLPLTAGLFLENKFFLKKLFLEIKSLKKKTQRDLAYKYKILP